MTETPAMPETTGRAASDPLDGHVRQQRPEPGRGRHRRRATTMARLGARATARSMRCTGPSTGARRGPRPGIRGWSPTTSTPSAEGPDTEGLVTVRIAAAARRASEASGLYAGKARGTNIIAASIEAYVEALNAMLAEAHWQGAAEAAGNRQGRSSVGGAGAPAASRARRGRGPNDTTVWFER